MFYLYGNLGKELYIIRGRVLFFFCRLRRRWRDMYQHVILWSKGNHISKWTWVWLSKLPVVLHRQRNRTARTTSHHWVGKWFVVLVENRQGIFYLTFKLNFPPYGILYPCYIKVLMWYTNVLCFFLDNMEEPFTTYMTTESDYAESVSIYLISLSVTLPPGKNNEPVTKKMLMSV